MWPSKRVEWEIFQMNYSHTLLIPVQKVKWGFKQHLFNTSHSTHVWMVTQVRHQTINEFVGSLITTVDNIFSIFIFPEIICMEDLTDH